MVTYIMKNDETIKKTWESIVVYKISKTDPTIT